MHKHSLLQVAIMAALVSTAASADFGTDMEAQIEADTYDLFGVTAPLASSATDANGSTANRSSTQTAADNVDLASGLTASYLTRTAANKTDMMAFWPASSPTHLITCVEGSREFLTDTDADGNFDAGDKLNPSVQRIDLSTGAVETILRGMSGCDGIRTTPWGTVLATEEKADGGAYEIIDPLNVTNYSVVDRAVGTIVETDGATAATKIAKRTALPTMAWEGLEVLPSGVVIGGDELRPGSIDTDADGTANPDTDGGAMFKFVPNSLHDGSAITALSQSPLVAGTVHALQVSCVDTKQQFGQGCEIGNGAWIAIADPTQARLQAHQNGATGFYRPEDLHLDPVYTNAADADAIRFCWANTGNESAGNYAETMCAVDSDPNVASARSVVVNRFVEGDTEFNSMDNLAFQPVSGNLAVIEDHPNGDVWLCLPDGADRDIKSDGCIRILSVVDSSAEPTGFTFSPDGTMAYVSIQHSTDPADGSMDSDGYATDDVIVISGFGAPAAY